MKGIYKLYNDDQLVYIGKSTSNMKQRVIHHININKQFDRADLYRVDRTSDIAILETYLIAKHKPMYNTEYNYLGNPSIVIDEDKYLNNPIVLIDELVKYKVSINLRKDMEVIDLSIKEMICAGISFEEIIQTINDLSEIE